MDKELNRLESFKNWPGGGDGASPPQLSRSGFYYAGDGSDLIVTCFRCHINLNGSEDIDLIRRQHKVARGAINCINNSPRTLAVTATDTANVEEAAAAAAAPPRLNDAVDRENPDFDRLRDEDVRLGTFHDWPREAYARPAALACDGFFYTGANDRVQCAFCRRFISHWEPNNQPSAEHQKYHPDCPFVRCLEVSDIPREATHKVSGMRRRADRLSTFRGWSNRNANILDLVREGLFFVPTARDSCDCVKCFCCGVYLQHWTHGNIPSQKHKKYSPNCMLVLDLDVGDIPINNNVETTELTDSVNAYMDREEVRFLLDRNYAPDDIRRVLKRMITTGDIPTGMAILAALQAFEDWKTS